RYALRGIVYVWKTEQNFRSEVIIAGIVFFMMFIFPLRLIEQLLVSLLIVWVLALELVNTVLERTIDAVRPQRSEKIKVVKDTMAGAVLISAAGALVIGMIIFYPYTRNFVYGLISWFSV
ncbi:MAG: diacylglycerol kinase family protein, partial [Candidatus Moranbacteria bacterium]|nr:diacylglycerol kinase family protein [Candidatus Moranbacteria bacterium]